MAKPLPRLSGLIAAGKLDLKEKDSAAHPPGIATSSNDGDSVPHEEPAQPVVPRAPQGLSLLPQALQDALNDASAGGERLVLLDPHLIDPNPFAPRQHYPDELVLRRADELRIEQREAIHVIPHPDSPGRFIIADGWTRVLSCTVHGARDKLKAQIHTDIDVQTAAWFGYNQNEQREPHSDYDRAMFYEKLIAEGSPIAEVMRMAKVQKSAFAMFRCFAKLPDEIIEMVKEKPSKFGATAAYNLSRIVESVGDRKAISVAAKYRDEDHPVRWLLNQVQAALHPATHKNAAAIKHFRYANGFFKERPDGIEVSIQPSPEKRDEFVAALEKLLATVAIRDTLSGGGTDDGAASSDAGAGGKLQSTDSPP